MAPYGPDPATVERVIDGDTLVVQIDLGYGLALALRCRLVGINAPELSTAAGRAARDYVRALVEPAPAVAVVSYGWDKYGGRFDGAVRLADGRDLATAVLAAGHAVPYPSK